MKELPKNRESSSVNFSPLQTSTGIRKVKNSCGEICQGEREEGSLSFDVKK